MPWKDGEPKLDNNFEAAMHRLKSQERSQNFCFSNFGKTFGKKQCKVKVID